MTKPVLYYTPRSPPCRAVLLTAAALGTMNLKEADHLTPEFLKLSLHTIPVLDDNGFVITDSHVICSYLADKYAIDENKIKRMQVDARLFFDCGHLFPRARFMIEPVIYFGADTIPQEKWSTCKKAYDGLEKSLATSKYLCGESVTIADLCCVASVSTAIGKYPNVKAWVERLSELPYYKKNNQEGARHFVQVCPREIGGE
ncbi:hypothetical protein DOY81_008755 [Sarcophaga bullata]|nr:hypothetical protein DOY81_008755 [Sarcophaga bullata]